MIILNKWLKFRIIWWRCCNRWENWGKRFQKRWRGEKNWLFI